ncbi:MAG: glutamine-hydrolyzing carbamoyl-phosphate synthase small subunit [Spirochaetes bacterium]|nr:glutamine-hydrolyzing carbamoyl-phosphate synthase small subunit [Spirochaetota bacterium]
MLVTEDGSAFKGRSFGAKGETVGEVVFNTALSGYQEILTDPSYKGQIVTMTYTEIGNYGINHQDNESAKPHVEGFIARQFSKIHSNWRSETSLEDYLKDNNIIALENIDTRALTKLLRVKGSLKGIISTEESNPRKLLKKVKAWQGIDGVDLIRQVIQDKPYKLNFYPNIKKSHNIAVIDCGIKHNIVRLLEMQGMECTIFPAHYHYKKILKMKPDGIFISNGPGDPSAVPYVVETIRNLLDHKLPLFGICFGHQLLSLALGGSTYKLKFGHHGANHPVQNVKNKKVEITSQNHNYCVNLKAIENEIKVTHINLNDQTVEGIRHKRLPVFSVQYHPEASPGPHDSRYLFDDFRKLVEKHKK